MPTALAAIAWCADERVRRLVASSWEDALTAPGLITVDSMRHHLAQVNVSRLLAPLDSPVLAPFMAALDEVNAEGDRAPGFVWRLQTESGNATDVVGFGWDTAESHGVIVNLTTWTSTEALSAFVFSGTHLAIMRRRREWFQRAAEATTALWWLRADTQPTVDEAEDRVRHLRRFGPTEHAFTLQHHYPEPGAATRDAIANLERFCPA